MHQDNLQIIKFLISRFEDFRNWQIMGIVDCVFQLPHEHFLSLPKPSALKEALIKSKSIVEKKYESQIDRRVYFEGKIGIESSLFPENKEYIWQSIGKTESDVYGTVMFPVGGDKYLKVSFSK